MPKGKGQIEVCTDEIKGGSRCVDEQVEQQQEKILSFVGYKNMSLIDVRVWQVGCWWGWKVRNFGIELTRNIQVKVEGAIGFGIIQQLVSGDKTDDQQ